MDGAVPYCGTNITQVMLLIDDSTLPLACMSTGGVLPGVENCELELPKLRSSFAWLVSRLCIR